MASSASQTQETQTQEIVTHEHGGFHGIVKWFDRKKGFGFITVLNAGEDTTHLRKDIFVHHTDISTQRAGFKNLFQGEYVSFELTDNVDNDNYEFKATNVRGAWGGPLRVDMVVATRPQTTRRPRNMNSNRGRGGGRGRGRAGRGNGRVIRRQHTRPNVEERVNLSPMNEDEEFDVAE